MALKPVTVSQLNDYISRVIGTDPLLNNVVVKGEISNLKYHNTGHVYFSIVDATSRINCFLPRDYAATLGFILEEGSEVIITGAVRVFNKNGSYSLNVRIIEKKGLGDLNLAFEQMKAKLNQEGLFDQAHKKPIPKFPKKIGVITSSTGAAVKDILKIIKNRNNLVDVIIFPVLVQGPNAPGDIARMINFVNENFDDIDTLVVGRGGGSAEDLMAFNEEVVARAIFGSTIPVISAVGHEIDFTISDLVADLRAETPTAAAQIAVPDTEELYDTLLTLLDNLNVQLSNKVMYNKLYIDRLIGEVRSNLTNKVNSFSHKLEQAKTILEENNPIRILESGYSVLTNEENKVIDSISKLDTESEFKLTLKDGYANCIFTKIGSDEN